LVITPLLIGINHFIVQSVNIHVIVLGETASLIHIPSGSLRNALEMVLKLCSVVFW